MNFCPICGSDLNPPVEPAKMKSDPAVMISKKEQLKRRQPVLS